MMGLSTRLMGFFFFFFFFAETQVFRSLASSLPIPTWVREQSPRLCLQREWAYVELPVPGV